MLFVVPDAWICVFQDGQFLFIQCQKESILLQLSRQIPRPVIWRPSVTWARISVTNISKISKSVRFWITSERISKINSGFKYVDRAVQEYIESMIKLNFGDDVTQVKLILSIFYDFL